MPGKMDCFGQTDIGFRRAANEDQFLIADLNKAMRIHQTSLSLDDNETLFGTSQGILLLVADGMGGHTAGDKASRLAVETLTSSLLNSVPWFFSGSAEGDEDLKESLENALHRCEERLKTEATHHPQSNGMGTTLTAAYINWPRATLIHAGDSRCYLFRDQKLTQITKDHTVAQQLSEGGKFRSEDLEHSRWAHMLWNSIGTGASAVKPEVHQFNLKLGDALLLCTDGLVRHIGNPEIAELLNLGQTSQSICEALIERAKNYGGSDNITVVSARFLNQQDAARTAAAEAAAEVPPPGAAVDPFEDTAPEVATVRVES